nr:protein HEAT INTOLERANT 4-like [Ipomoea batatas]
MEEQFGFGFSNNMTWKVVMLLYIQDKYLQSGGTLPIEMGDSHEMNVAPQTLAINTVVPPQQSFSPLSSTVALSSTEPKPLPSPIAAVAEPNPLPSAEQKPSPSLPPAVEAYRLDDSACYGRFGITARTAPIEDLWQQVFTVGTKWDQLDMVYQYKWNFSNMETLNFIEYDSLFPDEEKQAIMVLKESCNLNNASLQAEIELVCE